MLFVEGPDEEELVIEPEHLDFEFVAEVGRVAVLVELVGVAVHVELVGGQVPLVLAVAEYLTVPQLDLAVAEYLTFPQLDSANLEAGRDDFLAGYHDVTVTEYEKILCVSSLLSFVPPVQAHFVYEFRRFDV